MPSLVPNLIPYAVIKGYILKDTVKNQSNEDCP